MATKRKLDMERICRVCLQENIELFLLFDENYAVDGVSISQILTECTIYKVERHDELPHQICSACMESARNAFLFKKRTEHSYRQLVTLLGDVSDEWKSNKIGQEEKETQTDKQSIYPCELCNEKFFDGNDLKEHRLDMHRGAAYTCKVCGRKFPKLYNLKCHLSLEHPQEGLTFDSKCKVCGKNFSRKDHMKRHMRNVHKIGEKRNAGSCNKSTLEEPEIDLKEEKKESMQVSNEFFNDMSLAKTTTHWDGFTEGETDSDASFDDPNATNPIPSDHDTEDEDDEKSLSKMNVANVTAFIKVESVDDIKFETFNEPELNLKSEIEEYNDDINDVNNIDIDNNIDVDNSRVDDVPIQSKKPTKSPATKPAKTEIIREYLNNKPRRRRNNSNTKDNQCFECQRVFSRHCHLIRHMQTHTDEKPHECDQCQKRFTRRDHLKKHVISLHGTKEFKCDQCDCAFAFNDALTRHKDSKHGEGPNVNKVHKCEFCEKSFTSKTYLRKHRLLHTDRVFACKHCEEIFKDKQQYKEHEKSHNTEQRNFLCNICGDSFLRNDYLNVHMRRHTGEKPYKCKFCGKGFPRATDVNVHERYHTGHKPNLCTLCGKGFHRAYNLTIHMRTHTGERPFQCEHCPKSFAQSNDLKAHVRRHTGERFKCNTCDAGFLQLYGLRQHALAAHGIHIESTTGRLQKFPTFTPAQELMLPPFDPTEVKEQLIQQDTANAFIQHHLDLPKTQ